MRAQGRKADLKTGKHTLCEGMQWKNAGPEACNRHFVWKFTRKCRTPFPRTAFCARLRSRNAYGHFTGAILCGNLQEKNPDPPVNTSIEHRAFYSYRKNPFSVATLFGDPGLWRLSSGTC